MRGWRQKKNEDFEWHKYVRTTIKLRREQRRETVEQVKKSAASGAKSAARRTVNFAHDAAVRGADWLVALSGATWRAVIWSMNKTIALIGVAASWIGKTALRLIRAVGPLLRKVWHIIRSALTIIGGIIAKGSAPILALLRRPIIRTPLGLIGVLAGTAAIWQWFANGVGPQVKIALAVSAATLLLAYGPVLLRAAQFKPPFWLSSLLARLAALRPIWLTNAVHRIASWRPNVRLLQLPAGAARGVAAIGIAVGIAGLGWFGLKAMPSMPSSFSKLASQIPLIGTPEPIIGRARVLSGDALRIGRKSIRLAGIDAPELQQRCKRDRRRTWRCGRAARDALSRLARRKRLRCEPSGSDDHGRILATCYVGKVNINARMVERGFAFAATGLLASYSAQEDKARGARSGIWRGKALHPADYRAKKWDEAKRRAPDGCPIKGDVTRAGKFYVLPWARNYRRVRITESRGERWFCSESAARAAGWQGAGQS